MSPHSPKPPSPPQSPEHDDGVSTLPTFMTTALQRVQTRAPLFTTVQGGERAAQTAVHSHQHYLLANRTRDIFRTAAVHIPSAAFGTLVPPADQRAQLDFMNACDVVMQVEKTFGKRRRYDICSGPQAAEGQLSVVMSELDNVWQVLNFGLFSDVPVGEVLGKIHVIESVSSFFTFVPAKDVLPDVPRLEMQPAENAAFGAFDLAVGGGAAVGRVTVYRYYYYLELLACTREEALFWMCLVIAAELETRPPLIQFYTTQ